MRTSIAQTEYCGGGALSERLSTGSMSENELRELCRQMSLALLYLHSNKVAHLGMNSIYPIPSTQTRTRGLLMVCVCGRREA